MATRFFEPWVPVSIASSFDFMRGDERLDFTVAIPSGNIVRDVSQAKNPSEITKRACDCVNLLAGVDLNNLTDAQKLAVAVLKGDMTAIAPLVDKRLEDLVPRSRELIEQDKETKRLLEDHHAEEFRHHARQMRNTYGREHLRHMMAQMPMDLLNPGCYQLRVLREVYDEPDAELITRGVQSGTISVIQAREMLGIPEPEENERLGRLDPE